jgi:hypothetical protein
MCTTALHGEPAQRSGSCVHGRSELVTGAGCSAQTRSRRRRCSLVMSGKCGDPGGLGPGSGGIPRRFRRHGIWAAAGTAVLVTRYLSGRGLIVLNRPCRGKLESEYACLRTRCRQRWIPCVPLLHPSTSNFRRCTPGIQPLLPPWGQTAVTAPGSSRNRPRGPTAAAPWVQPPQPPWRSPCHQS